jgi:uncharacterized protein (TIRG00374 family)
MPATGVFLLYLAFKDIDIQQLWTQLKEARFEFVFLSALCGFVAFISRAMRWILLMEPLGYKPSVKNTVYAVIFGYFANMAIPRLGEISKCGALRKTDNIPMDTLIGTVITERVIDFLCLLLCIFIVLVTQWQMFGGFFTDNIFNPLYTKYLSNPLILILLITFFAGGFGFLILMRKKLLRFKLFAKINAFITGMFAGIKSVFKMKKLIAFTLHTLFIWAMYIMMTYVAFFAIAPTANLTFLDAVFIMCIGGLGMTAPVQNGFGAFHWIVSLGLTLYAIPLESGLLYATITHESQTIMVLLLGPFAMLMIFLTRKKQRPVQA